MARERQSVLFSDEVEALSHAFDRAPPPRALQLSLRLKSLVKTGSFASAMIILSYGEMTPHDTQLALRDEQTQSEPTWLMLQRFPLALTIDASWPVPDLTMPTLTLLAIPKAIPPIKPKSSSQAATIRAGDNPSSNDLSRQAAAAVKGPSKGGTVASVTPGPSGTTGSPRPSVKPTPNNPLTNLVSNIVSGFKQLPSSRNASSGSNKAIQSLTSGAIRSAIESARSTNSEFSGSNFGSKSFGGPSFSGLKKG